MTDWTTVKLNRQQKLLTAADLKRIPALYAQDGKGKAAICYVHFFYGPYDFWATEFDPETGEFFGQARFSGSDPELGYASAQEWIDQGRIERDIYWTPKPLSKVVAQCPSKIA